MGLTAEQIMSQVDVGRGKTNIPTDLLLGNSLSEVLTIWANNASQQMADVLNRKKGRSTELGKDIIALPVEQKNDYIEVVIDAPQSPYWDYVNEGVSGVLSGSYNSPYSFKSLSVAPSHQLAIQKWMGEVRIKPKQNQSFEQVAYVIARSVKEKGIEPTKFVEEVMTESYINEVEKAILLVTGEAIKIKINNGSNNR